MCLWDIMHANLILSVMCSKPIGVFFVLPTLVEPKRSMLQCQRDLLWIVCQPYMYRVVFSEGRLQSGVINVFIHVTLRWCVCVYLYISAHVCPVNFAAKCYKYESSQPVSVKVSMYCCGKLTHKVSVCTWNLFVNTLCLHLWRHLFTLNLDNDAPWLGWMLWSQFSLPRNKFFSHPLSLPPLVFQTIWCCWTCWWILSVLKCQIVDFGIIIPLILEPDLVIDLYLLIIVKCLSPPLCFFDRQ